jgi:prevent-host-death family protein
MASEGNDGDLLRDHVVTSAELNRNFGAVQERATRQPVIVTHHGRPRLALLSAAHFEALRARAKDDDGVARRKLGLIINSIREGYLSVDAELRIVTVNRVAEILLGRTRDELAGTAWDVSFPEAEWMNLADQVRRVIEHGKVLTLEVQLRLHGQRTVEVQAFPLPAPHGGAGILFFNVSETRRNEQLALEAEAKIRSLLSLLDHHAVVGVTPDRRIASWNSGAKAIFGWRDQEIVGEPLARIISDPMGGIFRQMQSLRGDGACLRSRQVPCIHQAGHALHLDAAISPSPGGWTLMLSQPPT